MTLPLQQRRSVEEFETELQIASGTALHRRQTHDAGMPHTRQGPRLAYDQRDQGVSKRSRGLASPPPVSKGILLGAAQGATSLNAHPSRR